MRGATAVPWPFEMRHPKLSGQVLVVENPPAIYVTIGGWLTRGD